MTCTVQKTFLPNSFSWLQHGDLLVEQTRWHFPPPPPISCIIQFQRRMIKVVSSLKLCGSLAHFWIVKGNPFQFELLNLSVCVCVHLLFFHLLRSRGGAMYFASTSFWLFVKTRVCKTIFIFYICIQTLDALNSKKVSGLFFFFFVEEKEKKRTGWLFFYFNSLPTHTTPKKGKHAPHLIYPISSLDSKWLIVSS